MATMTGRRWQELQEQLRSGRGRRATGGEGLFNVTANDLGQRSIFSRTPEINPGFDPANPSASVAPYLPTTASGRRLNVRNMQDLVEQARLLAAIKGQEQSEINLMGAENQNKLAFENAASGNRRAEDTNRIEMGGITTRDVANNAARLAQAEEERRLMRLGQSENPNLSPEQAMALATGIMNAPAVGAYRQNQAAQPFLAPTAESNFNTLLAKNASDAALAGSKDRSFFDKLNTATLAEAFSKSLAPIGQGGSVLFSPDGSTRIAQPATSGETTVPGEPIRDSKGNVMAPGTPLKKFVTMPASLGGSGGSGMGKIDLSKYNQQAPAPDSMTKDRGPATNAGPNPPQTPTSFATPSEALPHNPVVTPPRTNFGPTLFSTPQTSRSPLPESIVAPPIGLAPQPAVNAYPLNLTPSAPQIQTNGLGLLAPSGFESNIKRTIIPRAQNAIQELIRMGLLNQTQAPQPFPATNRYGF